jgi:archaemetzincin
LLGGLRGLKSLLNHLVVRALEQESEAVFVKVLHAGANLGGSLLGAHREALKVLIALLGLGDHHTVEENVASELCVRQSKILCLHMKDSVLMPNIVIKSPNHFWLNAANTLGRIDIICDLAATAARRKSCSRADCRVFLLPYWIPIVRFELSLMSQKLETPKRRFDSASFIPAGNTAELPLNPELAAPSAGGSTALGMSAPIVLLPVGPLDEDLLQLIITPVEQIFGRPIKIGQALPIPKYAYNPTREQYHSAAILKRVESVRSKEWSAVVGVTDLDMFVPEVPFVFGEADRSTRSAIISLSRMRSTLGTAPSRQDVLRRRFLSEVIHQMGLIKGLAQCPNNRCVMFVSSSVQETDKRGIQFCANCRKRLILDN